MGLSRFGAFPLVNLVAAALIIYLFAVLLRPQKF